LPKSGLLAGSSGLIRGRACEKQVLESLFFNDKMVIILKSQINLRLSSYVFRDEIDLNQLSFGISGGLIQSQLDETVFCNLEF
jgi:hypothetical protein